MKNDRLKSLLFSSHLSDCTFLIEGIPIKAHKLILSCNSPVFEKMFYGPLTTTTATTTNDIIISDITLDDFKQTLEFVYTDEITIKSIVNAWSLFYVAQKYLINDFIPVCIDYIRENLTIDNLVLSYEYADFFGLEQLRKQCLNDMILYTRGIFSNRFYYHMKAHTLSTILDQNLNLDQTELFVCVVDWAMVECDCRNFERLPTNIIRILHDSCLLKCLMDNLNLFYIKWKCLLAESDLIYYNSYLLYKDKYNEYYSEKSNTNIKQQKEIQWVSFTKGRSLYKISKRVDFKLISTSDLCSNISVNKKIALFGLVLTVKDQTNIENDTNKYYFGKIIVNICESTNTKNKDDEMTTIFSNRFIYDKPCYVPLSDLVILEPNKIYIIRIRYVNMLGEQKNSILCYYMSNTIVDNEKNIRFVFDEISGGVIRAISYYPV